MPCQLAGIEGNTDAEFRKVVEGVGVVFYFPPTLAMVIRPSRNCILGWDGTCQGARRIKSGTIVGSNEVHA